MSNGIIWFLFIQSVLLKNIQSINTSSIFLQSSHHCLVSESRPVPIHNVRFHFTKYRAALVCPDDPIWQQLSHNKKIIREEKCSLFSPLARSMHADCTNTMHSQTVTNTGAPDMGKQLQKWRIKEHNHISQNGAHQVHSKQHEHHYSYTIAKAIQAHNFRIGISFSYLRTLQDRAWCTAEKHISNLQYKLWHKIKRYYIEYDAAR